MKSLVNFFEIPATNFDRAVKFYESILSTRLVVMNYGREKMAFFQEENGIFPGAISWSAELNFLPSDQGVLISLNVENMETTMSSIKNTGGKIIIPKTKIDAENRGYFAVFVDCEGNRVGLHSDK